MAEVPKIGAPAERALQREGIHKLEQLTRWLESEVAALHGVGPKAVGILREALTAAGLQFKRAAHSEETLNAPSSTKREDGQPARRAAARKRGGGSAKPPSEGPTFFATPADFRAWLEKNHRVATELIVGFYKKGSGRPSITWPESVDEALCFGWIDGVRRSHGDEAYTVRFTPRKPTSIWSAVNVARVKALTEEGRMTPAGEAAFAKRREDRTAIYGHERAQPAELDPTMLARFRAHPEAWTWFQAQAPSYQRITLHWIMNGKKEETRERRFEQVLTASLDRRRL